jgi:DNA-binding GntR family transcriptional regulator
MAHDDPPAAPPPAPDDHAREAAEVLLCTAFLLAVPTLPERQLAWIRQMAAMQQPATKAYIDRNWPQPVREALLGPDRPST